MAALYFSSHDFTAAVLLRSRTLFAALFLPLENNKRDDLVAEEASSVAVKKRKLCAEVWTADGAAKLCSYHSPPTASARAPTEPDNMSAL